MDIGPSYEYPKSENLTPIAATMIEEVSREKRMYQPNETTERKRKRDIII